MSSYGRNFEFRVQPSGGQRQGRFYTVDAKMIGVPVASNGTFNALDLQGLDLVTTATTPVSGKHGILVYEFAPAAFAGFDPLLTTYSDLDTAPAGAAVQLVSGHEVKVVFRNTTTRTFLNTRTYAGKTMVAGIGATPTLAVGDYLTPGGGDTTQGFWAEGNSTNAWLLVTKVDTARGEVEARMIF